MEKTICKKELEISASAWSADLANLGAGIKGVDEYVKSYHFDLMDNQYVPSLLFGPDIIKALRAYTNKEFQAHLMISKPDTMFEELCDAGVDTFFIHTDCNCELDKVIETIKQKEKKIGLVIKTEQTISEVEPYLSEIDYVVIMGTPIGVKGKGFDTCNYDKIRALDEMRKNNNWSYKIQVDGGIRDNTVPEMYRVGADVITAGSLLFNNKYSEVAEWVRTL